MPPDAAVCTPLPPDCGQNAGKQGARKLPKITPTVIRSIVPPATGKAFIWCSTLPGFGVRTLPSGRSVYVVRYRTLSGTERTMALARCTDMGPDEARDLARDVFAAVRRGEDPARKREAARSAPTVEDLSERFMREHAAKLKPGTAQNYEILWRRHILPKLGKMKVAEVELEDVTGLHAAMSRKTPTNANRALEVLVKAFNLAEIWRWREKNTNPCTHVAANSEKARERVLTPDEFARLWEHLDTIDPKRQQPVPVLIRLLALTGCRVSEWRTARWEWVDLDSGVLRLPDSKTGAKDVGLSSAVVDILNGLTRSGPYLLPGRRGNPVSGHQKAWQKIRKAAGLPGLRLHDLRHTVGTHAADAGMSMREIADLLGHKSLQSTQRYVNKISWRQKENADKMAGILIGHKAAA